LKRSIYMAVDTYDTFEEIKVVLTSWRLADFIRLVITNRKKNRPYAIQFWTQDSSNFGQGVRKFLPRSFDT